MTIYIFATRLTLALLLGTLIGLGARVAPTHGGHPDECAGCRGCGSLRHGRYSDPWRYGGSSQHRGLHCFGRGILRRRSDFQGQRSNQRIESTSPPAGMAIGLTWSTV